MMRRTSTVKRHLGVLVLLFASLSGCVAAPVDGEAVAVVASAPKPALNSVAGNYLAGRFAQDQHDQGAAADFLVSALNANPDNVELLNRGFLSLAADGRLVESAALARRLIKFDEESAMAAILVAEQDARAGNWAAAEQAVADLPKRGLNVFLVPLVTAWARVGQGNIDGALEVLAPLAEVKGQGQNFKLVHDFHAALINDLADRHRPADTAYRAVVGGGERGLTVHSVEAAASFYRRIGQPAAADEVIAGFLRQHPEAVDFDFAPGTGRPVASAADGLAEALFGVAGSLRQGNAADLALLFARLALDLRPEFPLAQILVGDLLQATGHLQAANDAFRKIVPGAPVYWSAQLRIAANFDELGDTDGAARTLEALAASHPDRPDALITLGDLLRGHKRWAEATKVYDRVIAGLGEPKREQWALYYSRGIALERDKQWGRAEADFLTALRLEPDEPHVLNYLGYSWIEHGTNLDQARRMVEKAVEQRPNDGYIIDSLGWAYFRVGDYAKSVATLEKAVELHPEDATINDHLGDALWTVGRLQEARFQWRRALVFDPEPELKADIENKLKGGLPIVPAKNKNAAAR